ncbi:MAG: hypothetical protein V1763_01510 [Parcubacteria group bacterium]
MLNDRQKKLLKSILDSYIKTAQPIASGFLARKDESFSPATIRNEMMTLENQGYIFQPHTSSGRVPTEKAYRFYVENYLNKERELTERERLILDELKQEGGDDRLKIKNLAKAIAHLANQGVMVTFSECDNYYTGVSNIFSQPEFHDSDLVVNLSSIIDHLDNKIMRLIRKTRKEPEVLIGSDNPVASDCSLVVFNYQIGKYKGIIGLLGPVRMEYQKNYTLIKEGVRLLEEEN